jgi:hypothetical protein
MNAFRRYFRDYDYRARIHHEHPFAAFTGIAICAMEPAFILFIGLPRGLTWKFIVVTTLTSLICWWTAGYLIVRTESGPTNKS